MTPKKLTVILSLVLLAAGIALTRETVTAQEPAAPAPATPGAPEFSMFFSGGTFLGVYAEDVSKENMGRYGQSQVRGVGITEIVKGSPAEHAGLKKDDVILRFDNETVTSVRKLNRLVSESSPDQTTRITISRGGSDQEVAVTLGKRTENSNAWSLMTPPGGGVFRVNPKDFPKDFGKDFPKDFPKFEQFGNMAPNGDGNFVFAFGNNRRIGISTQTLTKQLADFFGVQEGGVLVSSVGDDTPAAKAGLRAGDIITAVDGEKLEGAGGLSRAINKKEDGDVTLTVVRDKNQRTVKVTPTKAENRALPSGRISTNVLNGQIRDQIRNGARAGRIVIPRIALPTIPAIDIMTPEVQLPVIPEINIPMPRVRVQRSGRYPI
ncbi:MAG: serine protease Do [Blastocatellia bacterium]|jgi:serine protease Do|nr:serine protease Do [Blastocatellia bacterium]